MELSFILSDASFDKKNKITKIVSIVQHSNFKREQLIEAINPKEAEKEGLRQSIKLALDNNIKKPIFICDNKFAINEVRNETMRNTAYKSFFHYIQFLWLPREMTSSVDKFTQIFNQDEQIKYNEYRKDKSKRDLYKDEEINEILNDGLTYKGNLNNNRLLSDTIINNLNLYRSIIHQEFNHKFNNVELDIIFDKNIKISNDMKLNGDINDFISNQEFVNNFINEDKYSKNFKLSLIEISRIIWN